MKASVRRSVLVTALCLGFITLAGSPATAQVGRGEELYVQGVTPVIAGDVLAGSGQRLAGDVLVGSGQRLAGDVLAGSGQRPVQSLPTQVLPLQARGAVAGTSQAQVQGLAFTGADIATLVMIALSAMTLGVVLTRRSRPRSTPQP